MLAVFTIEFFSSLPAQQWDFFGLIQTISISLSFSPCWCSFQLLQSIYLDDVGKIKLLSVVMGWDRMEREEDRISTKWFCCLQFQWMWNAWYWSFFPRHFNEFWSCLCVCLFCRFVSFRFGLSFFFFYFGTFLFDEIHSSSKIHWHKAMLTIRNVSFSLHISFDDRKVEERRRKKMKKILYTHTFIMHENGWCHQALTQI